MKKIIFTALFLLTLLATGVAEARRIVSLSANITKNLYLLGAGDRLVGCTRYCETDPADAVPVIADALSVNMERVALSRPDVVLASGLTHPRIVSGLERLGLKVTHLNQPCDFEEICHQLELLGELTGKQEVAAEINRASRERIEATARRVAAFASRPAVFFQIGADPLFTALPGTFMHDYIVRAGGRNIAEGLSNGVVSREFVARSAPDAILITAMGTAGDRQEATWRAIGSLPASRAGRIFTLDDSICSPTPMIFAETVEQIANLIHAADE
ncbi:MAG: ABC transporter substrate-binding protein [Odoribacteraceae bacterium]|jgi:iron complex transport system substrate-binding protein|nr:ABC transporter substrate-binding protein [Odoribacteraceae bacterium]